MKLFKKHHNRYYYQQAQNILINLLDHHNNKSNLINKFNNICTIGIQLGYLLPIE